MKQIRRHRAYKATDSVYGGAMKKAAKDGIKVAQLMEFVLDLYKSGAQIQASLVKRDRIVIFDVIEDLRNSNAKP